MNHQTLLEKLTAHVRETRMLASINALLEWDQQTMLPPKAAGYRGEQISWLAGQIHQRDTDPQLGEWLNELKDSALASDPHSDNGATIRELYHQFDKKRKLPLDLVQRQAKLHSNGQQIWIDARKNNDFASFAPTLDEIFRLKREEAEATCETDCLYDALLDDYETGAKTTDVRNALANLRDELVPLIATAAERRDDDADALLHGSFPVDEQREFAMAATKAIGFEYERGRLDVAAHPFCTESGPDDCRITTRYDLSCFTSAFFGCLHEAGHGMYEQGLRAEMYGLPPGRYCSLGIHESQSRLWENLVGRSRGFWTHFFAQAQQNFPLMLDGRSADEFYRAVNQFKPSLIRVEADEATYNLHIIIRFELEQALLDQQLAVKDLPQAWNEKYRDYLGITPPNDADGVLQDIHWSAGLVGYFPTYSLGNIYASMLFQQASSDIGPLEEQFVEGTFQPLLEWLRDKVHHRGNCYRADELVKVVTGSAIDHAPLIEHLANKVNTVYSVA